MSITTTLQNAVVARLSAPGFLPIDIPTLARQPKQPASDFESLLADATLCRFVMPPFPLSHMTGSDVVFFDRMEVRVRVIEQPALNDLNVDVWDVAEATALALHWQMFPCLAHPLQLASRPMEMAEAPENRAIDVIFHAALQLQR